MTDKNGGGRSTSTNDASLESGCSEGDMANFETAVVPSQQNSNETRNGTHDASTSDDDAVSSFDMFLAGHVPHDEEEEEEEEEDAHATAPSPPPPPPPPPPRQPPRRRLQELVSSSADSDDDNDDNDPISRILLDALSSSPFGGTNDDAAAETSNNNFSLEDIRRREASTTASWIASSPPSQSTPLPDALESLTDIASAYADALGSIDDELARATKKRWKSFAADAANYRAKVPPNPNVHARYVLSRTPAQSMGMFPVSRALEEHEVLNDMDRAEVAQGIQRILLHAMPYTESRMQGEQSSSMSTSFARRFLLTGHSMLAGITVMLYGHGSGQRKHVEAASAHVRNLCGASVEKLAHAARTAPPEPLDLKAIRVGVDAMDVAQGHAKSAAAASGEAAELHVLGMLGRATRADLSMKYDDDEGGSSGIITERWERRRALARDQVRHIDNAIDIFRDARAAGIALLERIAMELKTMREKEGFGDASERQPSAALAEMEAAAEHVTSLLSSAGAEEALAMEMAITANLLADSPTASLDELQTPAALAQHDAIPLQSPEPLNALKSVVELVERVVLPAADAAKAAAARDGGDAQREAADAGRSHMATPLAAHCMLSTGALLFALRRYSEAAEFLGAAHEGFHAWHYTPRASPYCAAYMYVILCELRRRSASPETHQVHPLDGESASCVARLRHLLLEPLQEKPESPLSAPLEDIQSLPTDELLDMMRDAIGLCEAAFGTTHVLTVQFHVEYATTMLGMLLDPSEGMSRMAERFVLGGDVSSNSWALGYPTKPGMARMSRAGARAASVTQWLARPDQMRSSEQPAPRWLSHWQTASGSLLFAAHASARRRAFRASADKSMAGWDDVMTRTVEHHRQAHAKDEGMGTLNGALSNDSGDKEAEIGVPMITRSTAEQQSSEQFAKRLDLDVKDMQESDRKMWRTFPEQIVSEDLTSAGSAEILWRPTAHIHVHESYHALQCITLIQETRRFALANGWLPGDHKETDQDTSTVSWRTWRTLAGRLEGSLISLRLDLQQWSQAATMSSYDAASMYGTRYALAAARHANAYIEAASNVIERRALRPASWSPKDADDDHPRSIAWRLLARANRIVCGKMFSRVLDTAAREDAKEIPKTMVPLLLLSKIRVSVECARTASLAESAIDGSDYRAFARVQGIGKTRTDAVARLLGPDNAQERAFAGLYESAMIWDEEPSFRDLWRDARAAVGEPMAASNDHDQASTSAEELRDLSPVEVHLLVLRARCSGEMGLALLRKARREAVMHFEREDGGEDGSDAEEDNARREQGMAELQFAASLLEQAAEVLWLLRDRVESVCAQPGDAWITGFDEDAPEIVQTLAKSCGGCLHLLPAMHDVDILLPSMLVDVSRYYGAAYTCFRDAERFVGMPLVLGEHGGVSLTRYLWRAAEAARMADESVDVQRGESIDAYAIGTTGVQRLICNRWMVEWLGTSLAHVPAHLGVKLEPSEANDMVVDDYARKSLLRQKYQRDYVRCLDAAFQRTTADIPAPVSAVRSGAASRFAVEAALQLASPPPMAHRVVDHSLYASIADVVPLMLHAGVALTELGFELCTYGGYAESAEVDSSRSRSNEEELDDPLEVLALAMKSFDKAMKTLRDRDGDLPPGESSPILRQQRRARVIYGIALGLSGFPESSNRALVDAVPQLKFASEEEDDEADLIIEFAKERIYFNDQYIASLERKRRDMEEMLAIEKKYAVDGDELGLALTTCKLAVILVKTGDVERAKQLLDNCGGEIAAAGEPYVNELKYAVDMCESYDRFSQV